MFKVSIDQAFLVTTMHLWSGLTFFFFFLFFLHGVPKANLTFKKTRLASKPQ